MGSARRPLPPERTWWILWFALLAGPFITFSVIPSPKVPALASIIPWQIALIPLAAGSAIRWTFLPRVSDGAQAFVLFVVGLALCEVPVFLGLALFPEMKRELFFLSSLGMAQFVPTFAKRFYGEK